MFHVKHRTCPVLRRLKRIWRFQSAGWPGVAVVRVLQMGVAIGRGPGMFHVKHSTRHPAERCPVLSTAVEELVVDGLIQVIYRGHSAHPETEGRRCFT